LQVVQTGGSSIYARDCDRVAVVPVNDSPAEDLCSALPTVDAFCLATYAHSRFEAILARVLEQRTGPIDLGRFGASFRLERHRTRTAVAQGSIRIADGRSDPAFFGGHPRLLHDVHRWKRSGELLDVPVQLRRLRELENAGVDVVEFPVNPAVDMRFARIKLAQPIVICQNRFRAAEASGRVTVRWS
jgi:hypothetical protein